MSFLQRRTTRVSLAALAVVGFGFGLPLLQASAEPSPTAACLEAGNVWVHVELDDTVGGGCATEFGTGIEALTSAGFDVAYGESGFVDTIDGNPTPRGEEDWWSYAHTGDDLSGWEFYEVGATQSAPAAGSIEAWRLMHTYSQDVSSLPLIDPADLVAEVEATPSATPSVSETATPSSSPSASATASASPTASSAPTATALPPSLPHTGN